MRNVRTSVYRRQCEFPHGVYHFIASRCTIFALGWGHCELFRELTFVSFAQHFLLSRYTACPSYGHFRPFRPAETIGGPRSNIMLIPRPGILYNNGIVEQHSAPLPQGGRNRGIPQNESKPVNPYVWKLLLIRRNHWNIAQKPECVEKKANRQYPK